MNVARAKLDLIKPEEVNMDEYEVSSGVFIQFKTVDFCLLMHPLMQFDPFSLL